MSHASPPADASNWREAPHRHWAFHNVAKILPTDDIAAAPEAAAPLAEALQPLAGFRLASIDGGAAFDLAGFLDRTSTDALVILHRGRIVFEHYGHGTARETPHIFMSVTKAMTGLLAGLLQHNGALDIEAPITAYIPELAGSAYSGATIRQLLDMRTGVVLDAAQTEAYEAALRGAPDAAAIHRILAGLDQRRGEHGGSFSYISANTDVLGWVMERATERSYAELMSERIWKPMGAEQAAAIVVDREGSPWCSGGFNATARDFARVGDLLLNGGSRGGDQILPKAWIEDLGQGGDRDAWRTGDWGQAFAAISPNMSYRAGWYAVHDGPGHLLAMGTHGQNLFIDHMNQIAIAKFSSQERWDHPAVLLTHRAVPELTRCVLSG